MQVPGGRMAEISGTKVVFGLTMAGTALLAALTPLIAHLGCHGDSESAAGLPKGSQLPNPRRHDRQMGS